MADDEQLRATGLARAEQVIEKMIEAATIPDPLLITAAAAHATAIAQIELARAEQLRAILDALELSDANAADENRGIVLGLGLRGALEHQARIHLSKMITREDTAS